MTVSLAPVPTVDRVRHDDDAVVPSVRPVRILAICDEVDPRLYSASIEARRGQVDLLLSCGDLPAYYLDFVASMLAVPIYGIHGNHDGSLNHRKGMDGQGDWGMEELHGRVVHEQGLLIGGFDGSLRYNRGSYQYTETGMRAQIAGMIPQLLRNRLRHGRFLDILVTHAPPRHIHDQEDRAHWGFESFRWFLRTFKPRYHLHGHIHLYNNRTITRTQFHETEVLNAYPFRELTVVPAARTQLAGAASPART
jgi:uncharacterized protein